MLLDLACVDEDGRTVGRDKTGGMLFDIGHANGLHKYAIVTERKVFFSRKKKFRKE